MSTDELAEWLDLYGNFDHSPWMEWFDKKYCQDCDGIDMEYIDGHITECAYCEINNVCRFFPDREEAPNNVEILKIWLDEEIK